MMILRIVLLAASLLTAFWDGATSATVQWTQTQPMCLYRRPAVGASVLIRCFDGVGRVTIRLGADAQQDAAYHPQYGDVYTLIPLSGNAHSETASLMAMPLFLPVMRR